MAGASLQPPMPRSGAATPSHPQNSAPGAQLPKSHSGSLGTMLKHLLEQPKTATFAVTLKIHELSNIPQLGGGFAVRWKFRGSKPSNGDRLVENPEQRAPLAAARASNPSLRHAGSMMSLRTANSGSGASTPQRVPHKQRSATPLGAPGARHPTLPPSVVSRTAAGHASYPPPNGPGGHRKEASGSSGQTGTTGTSSILIDPPPEIDLTDGSAAPSANQSSNSLASLGRNGGSLPVPARAGGRLNGATNGRYGTAPASLNLDDGLRVPSRTSYASGASTEPQGATTAATDESQAQTPDSTERKGVTPIAQIHAHRVQWEYEVKYVIRVPLGKPVPVADRQKSRQPSPQRRSRTLPILGEGAMSASGLKLEVQETPAGQEESKVFGYVNVDLAPFAEIGPTARKFLLKDSKTNATIRISVDMQYIGGAQEWVTPPFNEGHYVTDISQITGDDNMYKELQLLPTFSRSSDSGGSGGSIVSRPSFRSGSSDVSLTRQPAATVNAVTQQTRHRYKGFEHHLRPDHARRVNAGGRAVDNTTILTPIDPSGAKQRPTTSTSFQSTGTANSVSTSGWSEPPRQIIGSQPLSASPMSTPALKPKDLPPISPVDEKNTPNGKGYFEGLPLAPIRTDTTDLFRPEKMRTATVDEEPMSPVLEASGMDLMSPVLSPTSPDGSPSHHHHRRHYRALPHHVRQLSHQHSHRHYLQHSHSSHHRHDELQPDLVIERVFNPRAAEEVGPFTFVPFEEDEDDLDDEPLDEMDLYAQPEPIDSPVHHRRWSRIRRRVIPGALHRREATDPGMIRAPSAAVY